MSDLFISYSRKDIAYARLLHKALKEHDLDTWIDWQDIPPSTEWLNEVYTAIEGANTFIFILSSTSALSEICILEIDHARKNNKRIVPIVIDDVEPSKVHPALAAINWIFSRSNDELQPAIESLIEAIQTDYDWVKAHTRLQMRALEWERASQDKSFLLQGTDLQQAENWLVESVEKEPEPTLKQTRYIQSSRQDASKKQRRLLLSVGAALIVTIVLGVFAAINWRRAEENARLAHIRELTAISQLTGTQFDIAMLLGIESYNSIENYQTTSNLLRLTQLNPEATRFMNHEFVRFISISPDGKYLASADFEGNGSIVLWDSASGQPLGDPLLKENGGVYSIDFSPDGKILASGYSDGEIILWDVESGQPGEKKGSHSANYPVNSIAFSPDGKILASGSEDDTIILRDIASMKAIYEPLRGYYGEGGGNMTFSPDGKILAYTSGEVEESKIILWDIISGQPIGEPLQGHGNYIHDISFSPDGSILGAVGEGQWIKLWDVTSGQPITETNIGHTAGVLSIRFSPDGSMFATSSRDRTIILWDVVSGQPISKPLTVHQGEVTSIAFSPDGNTLASCSLDGTIIIWDMTGEELIGENVEWHPGYGGNNVAFSPDGKTLAIGYGDGSIILRDVASRQSLGDPLRGHEGEVASVAFSLDGITLASSSLEGTVILWDIASRQPLGDPLIAVRGDVEQDLVVSLSPDGAILASGNTSKDNTTIILWDTVSSQPLGELIQRNTRYLTSLTFSPDGNFLAAGYEGGTMLWDVVNMKLIGNLGVHTGWVDSLAFSPDGAILASGSDDATIILWDVANLQPLGDPLRVHNQSVSSINFSPDGELLASSSYDGTIILWDAATMQPLGDPLKVADNERGASIIAFSQDGKTLISLSEDSLLISWSVTPESWLNRVCERVGRNFTQEEWAFYFPSEPYHKTCDQWPEEK